MKNKIVTILFVCSSLFCFFTSCDEVEYNVYGSILGTVADMDTDVPIPNATVTLSPSGKTTYTDVDGNFEFVDLVARQYTVTVQKKGYVTNRVTVTNVAGSSVNISLSLEKSQ